jgi:hypothetical protein
MRGIAISLCFLWREDSQAGTLYYFSNNELIAFEEAGRISGSYSNVMRVDEKSLECKFIFKTIDWSKKMRNVKYSQKREVDISMPRRMAIFIEKATIGGFKLISQVRDVDFFHGASFHGMKKLLADFLWKKRKRLWEYTF